MKRWRSIRIYKTDNGYYIWTDHAGWGPGSFKTWLGAFSRALRGGW